MKRASTITLSLIGAFSAIQMAWAVDYPLPPAGSRLIGQNQTYTVQESDKNLQAIARHFDTCHCSPVYRRADRYTVGRGGGC